MKKTIEEMRAAVITQLVEIRDEIDYRGVKRLEWLSVEVVKFDMLSVCVFDKPYAIKLDGDIDPILLRLLYSGLGLEARDAVEELARKEAVFEARMSMMDAKQGKYMDLYKAERAKSEQLEADAKETAEVITALKKYIVQIEGERDKLVEALEEIKAEFNRLKSNAKSLRDAVYLDGVLAVIESISGKLLEAHKEGAQND